MRVRAWEGVRVCVRRVSRKRIEPCACECVKEHKEKLRKDSVCDAAKRRCECVCVR